MRWVKARRGRRRSLQKCFCLPPKASLSPPSLCRKNEEKKEKGVPLFVPLFLPVIYHHVGRGGRRWRKGRIKLVSHSSSLSFSSRRPPPPPHFEGEPLFRSLLAPLFNSLSPSLLTHIGSTQKTTSAATWLLYPKGRVPRRLRRHTV